MSGVIEHVIVVYPRDNGMKFLCACEQDCENLFLKKKFPNINGQLNYINSYLKFSGLCAVMPTTALIFQFLLWKFRSPIFSLCRSYGNSMPSLSMSSSSSKRKVLKSIPVFMKAEVKFSRCIPYKRWGISLLYSGLKKILVCESFVLWFLIVM